MTEVISIAELRKLTKPKGKHTESNLQSDCVKWFRYAYPKLARRLFAIPNGGKRGKITAAIMKREGVLPGVSDLFLAVPKFTANSIGVLHHGMFIEMKAEDGKLSEEQKWFINEMSEDYKCVVVRSSDQFRKEIQEYIG